MKRGDLVVRNGRKGTIVHMRNNHWIVVYDMPLCEDREEDWHRDEGVSYSSGWDNTPSQSGWVLDAG